MGKSAKICGVRKPVSGKLRHQRTAYAASPPPKPALRASAMGRFQQSLWPICGHWPSLALRLRQAVASNTTLRYPRSKLTVRLCTGQQADLDAQENFGYQRGHEHRQCIWRPESQAGMMFAVNQAVEFPPRSELKRQAAPGNVGPKPFVKVVGDQSHQLQQQR